MIIPIAIAVGSAVAVGAIFEFLKHRNAVLAAATAATNAQTLQQPVIPAAAPPPQSIQQVAIQAAAQAAAQDASGDPTTPTTASDPIVSQAVVAAQAAQAASQAAQRAQPTQPTGPVQDTFRDPTTGLNTASNTQNPLDPTVQQDPSLVNQIQNVLGI